MLFTGNLEHEEARLHWQCRRGMLELDLMLQSFVEKRYSDLPLKTKKAFHQLLKCQDQILLDYLMGQDVPGDKDIADVAKQVRDAAGPEN
ncbi:MAG: succinate dehydrogenase assembly factor 2 [Gammaproteobacteria bacterium]|nr:succinate dehydrogenase assembly factor 2 [Gammaproteobacteria bacterium]